MSHAFSAAVKLADLDDFLSPAQSCILPLLDSKGSRQNVVDSFGDHSVTTGAHSSTPAREASVRPSVSHPAGHGRTRKTTRHAAKQEITRLSSFSSAAAEASSTASSALLSDGAGLTITAVSDTASGTAFQQAFSGNVFFAERNSGKQGMPVATRGYASSSTYTRSSLIKLGQSRGLKESTSDSLNPSPPVGAGCNKKTNSFSTTSAFSSEISSGPPAVASAAGQSTEQVARVALYDCLACKGCVTSSEAILIERHSIDEFLRRTGAAMSSPCATAAREKESGYAGDSISGTVSGVTTTPTVAPAGDKIANTTEDRTNSEREAQRPANLVGKVSAAAAATQAGADIPPRLVVVSISPQSLTALQQHFHMKSAPVTLRKLSSLFRMAGATHVLHTAVGDALSVLEVEREFISRCREAGIGRREDAVIRDTRGAPAASLCVETQQQSASETVTAAESQITKGVAAARGPAAELETAGEEAAGGDAAGVAVAGVAVAGVAVAGVAAAGVAAGEEERSCLIPGTTAGTASRRIPEEQTATRELAGTWFPEDHSKGVRSCWSDACHGSDVKNSRRREQGNGRLAEFSAEVSAFTAAVSDAQPQQHQEGDRQQEQQQQHQEEQGGNPRREQDEQQQQNEQQQQRQQQQQVRQQDRQNGYREVYSLPFPSEEKAAESPVLPLLASFCPGFVCYAETSYDAPLLLQHMSRVRSGQQIQGILVKGLLLELHNAASFLLRSTALTAVFSGTGIPPLLLQLLLRKSAYASLRCLEAAPARQGSAGERVKQETTDPSSALDPNSIAAAVSRPGAAGAACQSRDLRQNLNDTLQHEQWTQHGAANSSGTNLHSDSLSLEGRSIGAEENIRPEDVFHVCVMPCFDKKLEAARPEFRHPTSRAAAASMAAAPAADANAVAFTDAAAPVSRSRRESVELPLEVRDGNLASPDLSSRNKSSGSSMQDDVTVADVDLVLATNEVPVLLQRMNVLFEDLPESHVDTFLDDFFPLRSRIACVDLSSGIAATAGGGTSGTGAADRRNKQEEATSSCWSSKDAVASASASDVAREKAALIYSSYVDRISSFRYISSAVSLLPRLRSLMLSPLQILLHPAAAITPYLSLSSRWRWCRTCFFDTAIDSATRLAGEDEEEEEDSAAAATAARVATMRGRPLAIFDTNAALPSQSTNANVLEMLHATFVERNISEYTGNVRVHENCNNSQAATTGCFISTEQMCGSGGYAERVFRRGAKELFDLKVEGPLTFQKRKKGDEGYKEAVLVVDGEEKLRVALVYGFKNIQNVVQKLKRQRRLETQQPPAAAAAIEQQDMQMQSKKMCQEQGEQEEQKQPQERQRTFRSLPHFLEFAACPGGCLCGGGQKLDLFKKNASSSSCAAVASPSVLGSVSSSAAASTLRKGINVEHLQGASEAVAQLQREKSDSESSNAIFSGRTNSSNIFVDEKDISPSSEKCVYYRASAHVSPAGRAAPSAATEQERAPGTGQAKPLETLTKFLHDSHVYCDPLQRVEVQLAYLYLFHCAEDADNKRQQGQRTAGRDANTWQRQQQLRQHTQMQQEQQPEHPRERIDQEWNLRSYKKTLQQQQIGGKDDQWKLTSRQEAQEQQQRHKDQPQQQGWRKKDRETKHDVHRDGIIAEKETTDMAGTHAASSYLSAVGTRTTEKSAGCVRTDGLTCFSPLLCGEKTLFGSLFMSVPCGIREFSAVRDTVTDTAAETAGAISTKSAVVSHATNATERASTKATEVVQAPPTSAWWNAFGENRTAVKLLRTRFRNMWGGKKEQPQKGDAAVSDVNFSSPPAQHRAAGAKPSLHW